MRKRQSSLMIDTQYPVRSIGAAALALETAAGWAPPGWPNNGRAMVSAITAVTIRSMAGLILMTAPSVLNRRARRDRRESPGIVLRGLGGLGGSRDFPHKLIAFCHRLFRLLNTASTNISVVHDPDDEP